MKRSIVVASLMVLVCFALLCTLGVWQLDRREWKLQLLDDLQARIEAAPFPYDPDTFPPPEFTHVTVTGDLRSDKPLLLYGRTLDGVSGVHVFAVLFPADGTPVLVDEGFLPSPQTVESAATPASFNKTVTGIIRFARPQGWFEPDNDPAQGQWYWIDLPRMARELGTPRIALAYVEATEQTASEGPVPVGNRIAENITNNHLQYAITWFALAATLIAVYAVWLTRELKGTNRA